MSGLVLSGIWRYPVKSLRGGSLETGEVDQRGLTGDRRWMLVDAEGRFLSQRERPAMSLVDSSLEPDRLLLRAPGMGELSLPAWPEGGEEIAVSVWGDQCRAVAPSSEADGWFSEYLGQACRLVWQPPSGIRQVDQQYARPDDRVGFADGFPFLLISQASLDELNGRLDEPVPMLRFRPNLVVSGGEPFQEDRWREIRIGALSFRVVKPCSRCVIPTIDTQTGVAAAEPLRTLATYRKRDNKVYFGQNLIHDGCGTIALGMEVEILSTL